MITAELEIQTRDTVNVNGSHPRGVAASFPPFQQNSMIPHENRSVLARRNLIAIDFRRSCPGRSTSYDNLGSQSQKMSE